MKPAALVLLAAGIGAGLAGLWLGSGQPGWQEASGPSQPAAPKAAGALSTGTAATAAQGIAGMHARSGGEHDAFLDAGLRHRLEDLLLEAGEAATPAALKQRLASVVPRYFQPADAVRAQALLERYVDYRVALGALKPPADSGDPQALRAAIDARQRVREQHFTAEEYRALFAQEEELDRYTLARLEIERNASLTQEQKKAALRDAEHELGADQRAARVDSVAHMGVAAQTAGFDARGVGEHERYAQRQAQYGDAAARQLAQLDRQEQDWQRRLDDYAGAQARKMQPSELQQLRQQLFSAEEQLRIEAALALRSLPAQVAAQR